MTEFESLVTHVQDAIYVMYNGGQGQNVAIQWLHEFNSQPAAWDVYPQLLLVPTKDIRVKFYAANGIYSKVRKEWHTLDAERRSHIEIQLWSTLDAGITMQDETGDTKQNGSPSSSSPPQHSKAFMSRLIVSLASAALLTPASEDSDGSGGSSGGGVATFVTRAFTSIQGLLAQSEGAVPGGPRDTMLLVCVQLLKEIEFLHQEIGIALGQGNRFRAAQALKEAAPTVLQLCGTLLGEEESPFYVGTAAAIASAAVSASSASSSSSQDSNAIIDESLLFMNNGPAAVCINGVESILSCAAGWVSHISPSSSSSSSSSATTTNASSSFETSSSSSSSSSAPGNRALFVATHHMPILVSCLSALTTIPHGPVAAAAVDFFENMLALGGSGGGSDGYYTDVASAAATGVGGVEEEDEDEDTNGHPSSHHQLGGNDNVDDTSSLLLCDPILNAMASSLLASTPYLQACIAARRYRVIAAYSRLLSKMASPENGEWLPSRASIVPITEEISNALTSSTSSSSFGALFPFVAHSADESSSASTINDAPIGIGVLLCDLALQCAATSDFTAVEEVIPFFQSIGLIATASRHPFFRKHMSKYLTQIVVTQCMDASGFVSEELGRKWDADAWITFRGGCVDDILNDTIGMLGGDIVKVIADMLLIGNESSGSGGGSSGAMPTTTTTSSSSHENNVQYNNNTLPVTLISAFPPHARLVLPYARTEGVLHCLISVASEIIDRIHAGDDSGNGAAGDVGNIEETLAALILSTTTTTITGGGRTSNNNGASSLLGAGGGAASEELFATCDPRDLHPALATTTCRFLDAYRTWIGGLRREEMVRYSTGGPFSTTGSIGSGGYDGPQYGNNNNTTTITSHNNNASVVLLEASFATVSSQVILGSVFSFLLRALQCVHVSSGFTKASKMATGRTPSAAVILIHGNQGGRRGPANSATIADDNDNENDDDDEDDEDENREHENKENGRGTASGLSQKQLQQQAIAETASSALSRMTITCANSIIENELFSTFVEAVNAAVSFGLPLQSQASILSSLMQICGGGRLPSEEVIVQHLQQILVQSIESVTKACDAATTLPEGSSLPISVEAEAACGLAVLEKVMRGMPVFSPRDNGGGGGGEEDSASPTEGVLYANMLVFVGETLWQPGLDALLAKCHRHYDTVAVIFAFVSQAIRCFESLHNQERLIGIMEAAVAVYREHLYPAALHVLQQAIHAIVKHGSHTQEGVSDIFVELMSVVVDATMNVSGLSAALGYAESASSTTTTTTSSSATSTTGAAASPFLLTRTLAMNAVRPRFRKRVPYALVGLYDLGSEMIRASPQAITDDNVLVPLLKLLHPLFLIGYDRTVASAKQFFLRVLLALGVPHPLPSVTPEQAFANFQEAGAKAAAILSAHAETLGAAFAAGYTSKNAPENMLRHVTELFETFCYSDLCVPVASAMVNSIEMEAAAELEAEIAEATRENMDSKLSHFRSCMEAGIPIESSSGILCFTSDERRKLIETAIQLLLTPAVEHGSGSGNNNVRIATSGGGGGDRGSLLGAFNPGRPRFQMLLRDFGKICRREAYKEIVESYL